jgi:DNA-binding MarR family transcriptional regulator
VTRAVDQLERKGLVERCVFEAEKRGYLATLTSEGRTLLRRATVAHLRGLREHFLKHLRRFDSSTWRPRWRQSSPVKDRHCLR